jgi:hypothetical protein
MTDTVPEKKSRNMPEYEPGDHAKFEMKDEQSGESEWMWLKVDTIDPDRRVLFGRLDSEPVVFAKELKLGQEIAVSYDNVRDQREPSDF